MGGQVQMLITAIPTVLSLIRAGNLRALMVTSEHPVAVLPDVPSATQLGLPQMVMQFWIGFAVPAKTAAPIVLRLNREIVGAITEADTRNRLSELGLEAVGYTSEAATRVIDDEIQRWSAVIQASGIKAN
jgi:tripartite-type tricarboxylate transporter receptor subunit TctC